MHPGVVEGVELRGRLEVSLEHTHGTDSVGITAEGRDKINSKTD